MATMTSNGDSNEALEDHGKIQEQVASLSKAFAQNVPLDEAVRAVLPKGTRIGAANVFGTSAWSFTARIDAADAEGRPTPFFLKYVPGKLGEQQLLGEFTGMRELHKLAPNFVPEPIGWGKLHSVIPTSYFLLVAFKDFVPRLPDPALLGARVAEMHEASESPNGMFGFPVQTFDGARLQAVGWDPSWTSFFSKLLAEAHHQDILTNGVWPEMEAVYNKVQSHLIPRLIGALESDGRSVKPTLIHGDMWDGNVGTEKATGNPWIYDCAAYYAHNEMELGIWRAERHHLRAKIYRQEYFNHIDPSEPEEECDDRNRLYSAKTNFMHSACFTGSPARQLALDDFVFLLSKYVPGWDNQ